MYTSINLDQCKEYYKSIGVYLPILESINAQEIEFSLNGVSFWVDNIKYSMYIDENSTYNIEVLNNFYNSFPENSIKYTIIKIEKLVKVSKPIKILV